MSPLHTGAKLNHPKKKKTSEAKSLQEQRNYVLMGNERYWTAHQSLIFWAIYFIILA